jgi:hypothetical protein
MVEAEDVWQGAEWYRALSLAERAGAGGGASATGMSLAPDALETARGRLRAWKAQKPFEKDSLLAQRLALDSLSERELLALLAEPAENLKARIGHVPDWLVALQEAFARTDSTEILAHSSADSTAITRSPDAWRRLRPSSSEGLPLSRRPCKRCADRACPFLSTPR